jgi:hypothetical protein
VLNNGGRICGVGDTFIFQVPFDPDYAYGGEIYDLFPELNYVNRSVLCGTVANNCTDPNFTAQPPEPGSCPNQSCFETCINFCAGSSTSTAGNFVSKTCGEILDEDNGNCGQVFLNNIESAFNSHSTNPNSIPYIKILERLRTNNQPTSCVSVGFMGSIRKKIYIDEVTFICVPISDIDPSIINSLEDC